MLSPKQMRRPAQFKLNLRHANEYGENKTFIGFGQLHPQFQVYSIAAMGQASILQIPLNKLSQLWFEGHAFGPDKKPFGKFNCAIEALPGLRLFANEGLIWPKVKINSFGMLYACQAFGNQQSIRYTQLKRAQGLSHILDMSVLTPGIGDFFCRLMRWEMRNCCDDNKLVDQPLDIKFGYVSPN